MATDILLWVGYQHYPTIDDFVVEARARWCCKRVKTLPKGLMAGVSKVYLAHLQPKILNNKVKTIPVIFGYFVLDATEVVGDKMPDKIIDNTFDYNIKLINPEVVMIEAPRLCGYKKEEGIYLTGELVLFDEYIPSPLEYSRGFKYIYNFSKILEV